MQQCCHVLLGYALRLRILRIERGVGAACALATVCAAAVMAHSTSDDGFAQRLHGQARQAGQYPPANPAEAQKRAGSSSRALARHSVVPAAILVAVVYETPTLAHPAAAPIVTVSASRMGALGGSPGFLLGPCVLDCYYSRRLVSLARALDLGRLSVDIPFLHQAAGLGCTLLFSATGHLQHAPLCRSPSSALQSIDDYSALHANV